MRTNYIQTLVETALCVALAVALNFLAMRLPINLAGGSISLTMLPILVLALRRGPLAGAGAGLLFGFLDLLMEPFILFPAQVALDYPLPYLFFGLGVGLFASLYQRLRAKPPVTMADKLDPEGRRRAIALQTDVGDSGLLTAHNLNLVQERYPQLLIIVLAAFIGGLLRYSCHVLSGVLFFAEYAGDQNVWLYSLVYNVSYLGPSLIVSMIAAVILLPILEAAVPVVASMRLTAGE